MSLNLKDLKNINWNEIKNLKEINIDKAKNQVEKVYAQAKESLKVLESLQKEGLALAKNLMDQPVAEKTRKYASEKIAQNLHKIGIATQDEVKTLEKKLETLATELKNQFGKIKKNKKDH